MSYNGLYEFRPTLRMEIEGEWAEISNYKEATFIGIDRGSKEGDSIGMSYPVYNTNKIEVGRAEINLISFINNEELINCPFCGEKPYLKLCEDLNNSKMKRLDVACRTEGCMMEHGAGWRLTTIEDIVKKWNKRFDVNYSNINSIDETKRKLII